MNIENKLTQLYKHRLVLHIGFWITCLILGFFGEIGSEKTPFDPGQALHMMIHFTGIIGAAYFNMYFLIPRYLTTHKYQTYFVFVILTVAISTVFFQWVKHILHEYVLIEENPEESLFMFFHISFYCLLILMITSLFYFLRRRMNLKEMELKLQETEKQKAIAELKALKAQINPHLLFNALNNIYSLALENNTKTSKAVLELSELMNYVLYDCQVDRISLSKEIAFIKNYIVLEKSRFEDSVNVKLEVDESAISNVTLAPLLFIPFIENAFKHCNKSSNNIAEISIKFDTARLPMLKMEVFNTCETIQETQSERKGVGLENVKQRLEFLYPNRHILDIKENDNRFFVQLELDLS
jgi:two-component system, LytTR family, sensor kinase